MDVTVDKEVGKEFIEHFGTKGMRWGVRRSKDELGRGKGSKSEGKDEKPKPKVVVGKTKTEGKAGSQMSDAQLRRVINRLNMEQQYNKLTDPGPSAKQRAGQAISKFVFQAARNVAMTQVTAQANVIANDKIGALIKAQQFKNAPKPPNLFPTAAPNPLLRRG